MTKMPTCDKQFPGWISNSFKSSGKRRVHCSGKSQLLVERVFRQMGFRSLKWSLGWQMTALAPHYLQENVGHTTIFEESKEMASSSKRFWIWRAYLDELIRAYEWEMIGAGTSISHRPTCTWLCWDTWPNLERLTHSRRGLRPLPTVTCCGVGTE